MQFLNQETGYVCGNLGRVFATTNSGDNWVQLGSPVTELLYDLVFLPSSPQTGFICGFNGKILKTTNGGALSINQISSEVPSGYALSQNYPNPFNPATNIKLQIPNSGFVRLAVFDVTGREVAELVNETLNAGEYKVDFNASGFTSGVYFYKLTSAGFTETKRMVLVK